MSYAEVNGISLYYEEHGSGRPLVLLHGGLSAASMYGLLLRRGDRAADRDPASGAGAPPGDRLRALPAERVVPGASADAVRPSHIVDFYALLGGGLRDANWDGSARSVARLAILPGHTHYDIFSSPDLPSAVIPFLDAASLEPPAPFGQ